MKLVKIFSLAVLALTLQACGMEQIDEGYRGIYTKFGKVEGEPLQPGLHFFNPFTADVESFDVREQKLVDETQAFTHDTQNVILKYAVTYYPDPAHVTMLYSQFGRFNWDEKIVPQAVLGSIKDSIGQYKADDLVSKRETATRAAEAGIQEALSKRKVIVTRLEIINLDFNDEYEKAVEAKVTAVQHAIAEKNKTVQVMEQARQTIETAKADAEAMKIKTQALSQSKSLVQYEAVKAWNGQLPQIILGNGSMPILDLKNLTSSAREE